MARTHKIQLAHKVYSEMKDPAMDHPAFASDATRLSEWMRSSERHGNKRHAVAGRKREALRSEKRKENRRAAREIADAFAFDLDAHSSASGTTAARRGVLQFIR